MESIFKNIIIFISGFFLAIFIYRSPSVVKNQISSFNEESNEVNTGRFSNLLRSDRLGLDSDKNLKRKSSYTITKSLFNSNSTGASLDYVPSYSARPEDQTPTAPPTGRPEVKDETAENEENENKEETNKTELAKKNIDIDRQKKNYDLPKSDNNEKSLSSVNALVGSVVTQVNPQPTARGSTANNGGLRGGGSSSGSGNNTESDTLPNTFTASGFATAKRLYSSGSLSETEYLQYLNLGLSSQDETLENLASTELVRMKSKTAFSLLTQYASASPSKIESLNQAILASYRTVSDLNFLSLMIDDESSVENQNWAIHTLDVIINGSSMDFSNQQIKDALVKNVGPSLSRLPSSHPSFDQAQSISGDINRIFS